MYRRRCISFTNESPISSRPSERSCLKGAVLAPNASAEPPTYEVGWVRTPPANAAAPRCLTKRQVPHTAEGGFDCIGAVRSSHLLKRLVGQESNTAEAEGRGWH
jgi:hypothetical protein